MLCASSSLCVDVEGVRVEGETVYLPSGFLQGGKKNMHERV